MKMRKIAAMGLSAVMAASMVPALPVMADDASGKVYYLNFKPELLQQLPDSMRPHFSLRWLRVMLLHFSR